MKYTFRANEKGTHVRKSDNVRGTLNSHPDSAVIRPEYAQVDADDFREYVAPSHRPMRAVTKRELVDGLIDLGVAEEFNGLLGQLPLPEKLRWEASPTIAPDYPFIVNNRALLLAALNITTEQLDGLFRK